VEARRAFRDSSLGVRIEVEVNVLDPRQGGDEVLSAVGGFWVGAPYFGDPYYAGSGRGCAEGY